MSMPSRLLSSKLKVTRGSVAVGFTWMFAAASCSTSSSPADAPTVTTIDAAPHAVDARPTIVDGAPATIDSHQATTDATTLDARPAQADADQTPATFTTWNPADTGVELSLSHGDLTVTSAASSGLTRTLISKSAGKWYWEVTANSDTTNMVIGVADGAAQVDDYTGSDLHGWGLYGDHGVLHDMALINGGDGFDAYFPGDIIGCALDMDAQTIQFYKNGVADGTLITGLATTMFPSVGAGDLGVVTTANFGATAFTYSPPSGFNAGVY